MNNYCSVLFNDFGTFKLYALLKLTTDKEPLSYLKNIVHAIYCTNIGEIPPIERAQFNCNFLRLGTLICYPLNYFNFSVVPLYNHCSMVYTAQSCIGWYS